MAWNKPGVASAPSPTLKKKPTAWRGAVAGIIAVAAAALVAFFVLSGGDATPKAKVEKKTVAIKEVTPAAAPKYKESPETPRTTKPASKNSPMTIEERRQHVKEAQARMKDIPYARPPETNLIFKTATDQILAMVADIAEGKEMPPLPLDASFEREFVASLKEPIVINENDSEKIKELKTKVAELRKELDARASQGEPMVQVLKDFQDSMVKDYKMRDELRLEVKKMLETDGRESAELYCTKVNESLRQLGIKEIEMPMTPDECREWAEQFLKEREAAAAAAKANGGTVE